MQRRNRRSGVEDRWTKTVRVDGQARVVPSANHGKGNRWRARYVDDDGREHAKGFTRKVDAQKWLDNIVAAQITGNYVDPQLGKITFASFYREWSTRQVWVPSTRQAMDLAANSVTFTSVALGDLRPSHVETWVKAMQDKPLQPSTIRTRFVNVRGVVKAAVRDRVLAHDVTANIRLPRQRKPEAAMAIPTPAEVGVLLAGADDRARTLIALCAFAGLRLGEAAALRIGDIDFLRREIQVSRQVQRANGGAVEIRAPKYGSERTIFAPEQLLEAVSEHIRNAVVSTGIDRADEWLFQGERGHPWHQNTVGYFWRRARTAAKVDYRLHDLRHFYASGLIAAGCDVVTVQRALGHSSAAVTLKTYAHLWPDASDRTRKAAAGLIDQAVNTAADGLRTESPKTAADLQS